MRCNPLGRANPIRSAALIPALAKSARTGAPAVLKREGKPRTSGHPSTVQFVYAPGGQRPFAFMNGQTLANAVVPLPGGALVIYNPSGLAQYNHPDWLGSARLFSSPDRGTAPAMAYAPFGEGYAGGIPWYQFTASGNASIVYDSEGGGGTLHDFQYRHYSPGQGRWISPDPAGLAAVDPTNPQTWNRYAYVANNPLSFVDPSGLDQKGPGGSGCNASVYVCAGGGADGLGGGGLVYVVLGWTELGGSWGTVINFGGQGQTDNGQCNYGLANPCAANNGQQPQKPSQPKKPCSPTDKLNAANKKAVKLFLRDMAVGEGGAFLVGCGMVRQPERHSEARLESLEDALEVVSLQLARLCL